MATGCHLGVSGVKNLSGCYLGVGGVHNVKEIYAGIGGVVKLIWSGRTTKPGAMYSHFSSKANNKAMVFAQINKATGAVMYYVTTIPDTFLPTSFGATDKYIVSSYTSGDVNNRIYSFNANNLALVKSVAVSNTSSQYQLRLRRIIATSPVGVVFMTDKSATADVSRFAYFNAETGALLWNDQGRAYNALYPGGASDEYLYTSFTTDASRYLAKTSLATGAEVMRDTRSSTYNSDPLVVNSDSEIYIIHNGYEIHPITVTNTDFVIGAAIATISDVYGSDYRHACGTVNR